MKRYEVAFYDSFDGWVQAILCTDNLEEAEAYAKEKQSKLDDKNKKMGEHYAVYDNKYHKWCKWFR